MAVTVGNLFISLNKVCYLAGISETCASLTILSKVIRTEFFENPTDCLIADIRSQTDGRTWSRLGEGVLFLSVKIPLKLFPSSKRVFQQPDM